MIRLFGLLFFIVIFTIIMSSITIIFGVFSPYSKYANGTIRLWARSIMWVCGIKMDVQGLENIDPEKQYVYIANHQSNFDILACLVAVPDVARFVAKKELFRVPIFGLGMRVVGMIPIDRGRSSEARRTLEAAVDKVRKGISLIIFPEGTRSKDGQIHKFKKGGFVLAIDGEFDILPITISGSWHIMKKDAFKMNKGRIKVHFQKAIPTKKYDMENKNQLVDLVRDQIIENFDGDYR